MTDYTLLLKKWDLPEAILWYLSEQPGIAGPSAEDIAGRLGVAPETVKNALGDLIKRGLVRFNEASAVLKAYGIEYEGDDADFCYYNTAEAGSYLRRLLIEQ